MTTGPNGGDQRHQLPMDNVDGTLATVTDAASGGFGRGGVFGGGTGGLATDWRLGPRPSTPPTAASAPLALMSVTAPVLKSLVVTPKPQQFTSVRISPSWPWPIYSDDTQRYGDRGRHLDLF